ncbi:hypothetical protein AWV80_14800 [Cupriavidus sp. UYMU48A]|nr:hypothetical protein AWV80_14800 [Cupriavidus sp. UYMU48A]
MPFTKPAQGIEQRSVVKAVDAALDQHNAIHADALLEGNQVFHTRRARRVRSLGSKQKARAIENVDMTVTATGDNAFLQRPSERRRLRSTI